MAKDRGNRDGPRPPPKRQWDEIHLREWREFRGLTIEQLAERTGLSPGLISQIETGDSSGSSDSLSKCAKALGCTAGELLDIVPKHGGSIIRLWVHSSDRQRVKAVIEALAGMRRSDYSSQE